MWIYSSSKKWISSLHFVVAVAAVVVVVVVVVVVPKVKAVPAQPFIL